MLFRILGLVIASVKMALGATLLFIGSHLLYWGIWIIIAEAYIISWLAPWLLLGGFFLVLPGIHVAKNFGENLKGKYLALVSLTYLIAALSVILGFIPPQEPSLWWSAFWILLPPVILSTAILNVAFLIGHLRKKVKDTSILREEWKEPKILAKNSLTCTNSLFSLSSLCFLASLHNMGNCKRT